jgi:voltage-gated potassium channel
VAGKGGQRVEQDAGDVAVLTWLRRLSRRARVLTALSFLVLVVCPFAVWGFEHHRNPNLHTIGAAYQWLGRTIFETTSAYKLLTGGGFVVYYVVRIAAVSLVAFGTGTIASRLVTTVILKGKGMGKTKASGHILICGWSSKGSEIVRELRAKEVEDTRPIVVLSMHADDPTKDDSIEFLRGDPSDPDDLHRAGFTRCTTAIVLADESNPAQSAADQDARSLLVCLAIESIDPRVYTCAEVIRSENRQHFERTKVNEMVVSAELTGALLAGSARVHGLSRLVGDLVTHPEGQEFYQLRVPPDLVGTTVQDAVGTVKRDYDALLVGMVDTEGSFSLNPANDRVLTADDVLLAICSNADALAAHAIG